MNHLNEPVDIKLNPAVIVLRIRQVVLPSQKCPYCDSETCNVVLNMYHVRNTDFLVTVAKESGPPSVLICLILRQRAGV